MSATARILAHHSESVDPTLIDWIKDQIDSVIGLDAGAIVLLLGLLLVLFPVVLLTIVWRQRRRMAQRQSGRQD